MYYTIKDTLYINEDYFLQTNCEKDMHHHDTCEAIHDITSGNKGRHETQSSQKKIRIL